MTRWREEEDENACFTLELRTLECAVITANLLKQPRRARCEVKERLNLIGRSKVTSPRLADPDWLTV